ncbi:MAG: porin [Planctomycetia bacterium]|nr:porin [Planctomycetia bacterium]
MTTKKDNSRSNQFLRFIFKKWIAVDKQKQIKRGHFDRLDFNFGLALLIILGLSTSNVWAQTETTQFASEIDIENSYEIPIESENALQNSEGSLSTIIQSEEQLLTLQQSIDKLQEEMNQMKIDLSKKQKESETSKKFTCKVGGNLIMDSVVVANQNSANRFLYGDVQNQFDFRDIRFYLRGKGYDNLEYDCTLGVNNGLSFKDVGVIMRKMPYLSDVRVGYFKIESGMDHLQSTYDSLFNDFSSNTYTFRVGRRFGVSSTHYFANEKIRFFKGVFVGRDFDNDADVNSDNSGIILNTRLTGVPVYTETNDGDLYEILHLGVCYYWNNPQSGEANSVRLRSRPTGWTYSMPYYLNGTLPLDQGTYSVTQAEIAWQKQRSGILSEAFFGQYSGYDEAYGVNVQGRYFLTPGVYQQYSKEKGCFNGVNVPDNLSVIDTGSSRCFNAWGVWEAVAMWSWTDLNNLKTVPGATYGTFNELVAGVNWYWNSQMRITFNWVHSIVDSARSGNSSFSSNSDTAVLQMKVKF